MKEFTHEFLRVHKLIMDLDYGCLFSTIIKSFLKDFKMVSTFRFSFLFYDIASPRPKFAMNT